ncbi:hypothetical protein FGB62_69g273 [Gracilaria domingensis]|nr:hypothetical protein FGB62_69g273 [Gracilaria domingensis]
MAEEEGERGGRGGEGWSGGCGGCGGKERKHLSVIQEGGGGEDGEEPMGWSATGAGEDDSKAGGLGGGRGGGRGGGGG